MCNFRLLDRRVEELACLPNSADILLVLVVIPSDTKLPYRRPCSPNHPKLRPYLVILQSEKLAILQHWVPDLLFWLKKEKKFN